MRYNLIKVLHWKRFSFTQSSGNNWSRGLYFSYQGLQPGSGFHYFSRHFVLGSYYRRLEFYFFKRRNYLWYFANLGLRFWSSLAFLGLANLTQNKFSYLLKNIPKLLWAIVVLDVFTFMMFNLGLVKGEPAVVSVIGSAAPLVSITLAALFLKEKLSWLQKVGILSCLAGIITLSLV